MAITLLSSLLDRLGASPGVLHTVSKYGLLEVLCTKLNHSLATQTDPLFANAMLYFLQRFVNDAACTRLLTMARGAPGAGGGLLYDVSYGTHAMFSQAGGVRPEIAHYRPRGNKELNPWSTAWQQVLRLLAHTARTMV